MSVRGRKAANGTSTPPTSDESNVPDGGAGTSSISTLLTTPATGVERDEVKVNNASVTEMKHACDDALKRVSAASFTVLLNVILLSYERKHEV